jgi:hypothetical protein
MKPSDPDGDNGTSKPGQPPKRNIAPPKSPENGTRSATRGETVVRVKADADGKMVIPVGVEVEYDVSAVRGHSDGQKPARKRKKGLRDKGSSATTGRTKSRRPPHRPTKKTPEAVDRILKILGVGGTWSMAAAAAGISPDTLVRWRDTHRAFALACARARDNGAQKLVERIRAEAENGDWRAASWLLERISPDQYGRRVLVGGMTGGAPIQIEGELRAAGDIRSNPDATKQLHDAIATAVSGIPALSASPNGKASSNGKH